MLSVPKAEVVCELERTFGETIQDPADPLGDSLCSGIFLARGVKEWRDKRD
jgi:hypothetical protein